MSSGFFLDAKVKLFNFVGSIFSFRMRCPKLLVLQIGQTLSTKFLRRDVVDEVDNESIIVIEIEAASLKPLALVRILVDKIIESHFF